MSMKVLAQGFGVALSAMLAISGCAPGSGEKIVSVAEHSTLGKDVPIDALLVASEILPRSLVEKLSLGAQNPDTTDIETLSSMDAEEYRLRSWLDGDGTRPIAQIVLSFSSPAQAEADYQRMPNGRNFHIVDGLHSISMDIRELGLKADSANVFCVGFEISNSNVNDCAQWGFRARYGRYVVDVILRKGAGLDGYMRIGKDLFFELVAAVDQNVNRKMNG
ncbi:hypothetical protein [Streptosporangium sp. NPDC087985]|uniref:hypothetical protein n=1 Tax=Streptosporangium sp. NPDC087985 TaxID=3366196 RepID=UPI003828B960